MLDFACQMLDHLARAVHGEADHVDHHVRLKRDDLRAELVVAFGLLAVNRDAAHLLPRRMLEIGRLRPACDACNLMPRADEPRHEIRAYVSGSPDDDNVHSNLTLLCR